MKQSFRTIFDDALSALRAYKKLAEKAIAQLKDEEFFVLSTRSQTASP